MQTTLQKSVDFTGAGLHSGASVRLRLLPAPADTGVLFRRTDVPKGTGEVKAIWSSVLQTPLNTKIENRYGISVSTIEHVMAALAGCGIHNVIAEIDGPEVPIMDGSSREFVVGMLAAGIRTLPAPLKVIEVVDTVEVRRGDAFALLSPSTSLQIDFSIEFPDAAIGAQHRTLGMANGAFIRELADSRTFCRQSDVISMREQGLGLGGTLENAVVVDGATVLSPGGLRHADEPVRHKMLDALGDLSTAGAPLLARYTGVRAGHALTNELLRALFDRPDAWRPVMCSGALASRLPGAGVTPADLTAVA